jgi:hypothetical protein
MSKQVITQIRFSQPVPQPKAGTKGLNTQQFAMWTKGPDDSAVIRNQTVVLGTKGNPCTVAVPLTQVVYLKFEEDWVGQEDSE